MKIVVCHNYYQQPGGEDQSFADEAELLASRGHEVVRYTAHNDAVKSMGRWRLGLGTIWSRRSYRELRALVRRERAEVVHFTNTFPLISPSAYYAARREGAAVVQSLRNYRLLCPSAILHRRGRTCEDCLGRWIPWPGALHACYRESRAASAAVAAMLAIHRLLGTWRRQVDMYYALTEFSRRKFVEGGLPADQIAVKPNFLLSDPGAGPGDARRALFVGRLASEKGIETLLEAWTRLPDVPLAIVGDGPLADVVGRAAATHRRLAWLGRKSPDEVRDELGQSALLIFPSEWYEGLPRAIIEAYAKGTPVVAARLGSMAELVHDGVTGRLFPPGDPAALAQCVAQLLESPERLGAMRLAARREYERSFTAEPNACRLLEIYAAALLRRHRRMPGATA